MLSIAPTVLPTFPLVFAGWVRQPGFIAAFGVSCLAVFAVTVTVARYRRRNLADAAIDGLNASYPNTGIMGLNSLPSPAIAWGIAVALRLPPSTTAAALLLAALPTGTGPSMLAELCRCEAFVTARTILITPFVSIFIVALYLDTRVGGPKR